MSLVLSLVFALAATASAPSDASEVTPGWPHREPVAWPVCGRTTSGFGYRVDPFTGRVAFHSGLDIVENFGVPVVAVEGGTVVTAERRGPYGVMVEVDHGKGWRTRYGQLQETSVTPGQTVARGEKIAQVGSSGRSTGPHLHFEVWFNDVVRDPAKYLVASECAAADLTRSSPPEH
jgi:murein DD-endopeptidase MepM/ murein hydrolase activator NlpD